MKGRGEKQQKKQKQQQKMTNGHYKDMECYTGEVMEDIATNSGHPSYLFFWGDGVYCLENSLLFRYKWSILVLHIMLLVI